MENKTGVYYQAMPAVGPDGKNVMKLIPVQKVNGKFVQTQVVASRNDCLSQVCSQPAHISSASLVQNKLPTLQATSDGRFILKTPPESNIFLNSVRLQQQGANDLFKNAPNQVSVPPLAHRLQLPPQSNSTVLTVLNSPQQSATLKSPIFPSGHYLQIPPNATVRTLPASSLPQSIKSQICNSTNVLSNPAKSLPTVVYVSPVNSLKLGPNQQLTGFTKAGELPQSLAQTSTNAVKSLNASSTSSPKADQGVTAPMKWVIQEGAGNTAPCLIPVSSPNMTTDILKAVKQIETLRQVNPVPAVEPTSTHATQEKISPGKDNALVMCNGKVYFVAKKNSEISKDVISGVGSKVQVKNSGVCATNTVPKQDSKNTLVSKKPNEIIDLCDDDEEISTCGVSSRLTVLGETAGENDEDSNVIFVSYIPPKSDTETSKKVAETASQNGCVSEMDSAECEAGNMEKRCERNSTISPVIDLDVSGCEENTAACESVNGGGAVSEVPEEVCEQGTEVTTKISQDLVIQCRQDSEAVPEMPLEKPALEEIHQQKSDPELRRIFGITSDLKICLPRINQATESSPQVERRTINKRTLEGIRKLIQGSQIELKIKQLIQEQQVPDPAEEDGTEDVKRKRLEQDGQTTCLGPSSITSCSSPQSSKGTINCDDKMQSTSTKACADHKESHCRVPEVNIPSTSSSSEVAKQTVEPLCSSPSFQLQQTQTASSHTDGTAGTVVRKTPARQSKGSGRVCTACPCGTKVGAVMAHSSPPQDKPNSAAAAAVDCFKQMSVLTQSNKDCNTGVLQVLENSVLSPPARNDLKKSGDEVDRTSQLYKKSGEGSLQNTASLIMQLESVSQPGLSSQGKKCGSSSASRGNRQSKTGEKSTSGQEAATKHDPTNSKEVRAPSCSGEMFGVGENMSSEFYSSIMLDPEELKRQERIKRLKDLLKEKEAALEKLRKSM